MLEGRQIKGIAPHFPSQRNYPSNMLRGVLKEKGFNSGRVPIIQLTLIRHQKEHAAIYDGESPWMIPARNYLRYHRNGEARAAHANNVYNKTHLAFVGLSASE